MDMFRKVLTVRLRSHHDKYLVAGEDQKSIRQERDGSSQRATWHVELVDGSNLIRLKSCYGKYLTASDACQYFGMLGKKVIQMYARKPDSSAEWEPIREGVQVKLKSRYGYYLRANSRLWLWRNSITHNVPRRSVTMDWVLWEVEVVRRMEEPELAESIVIRPSHTISRSTSSSSSSNSNIYFSTNTSPTMSSRMYHEYLPNISLRMSSNDYSAFLSPSLFQNLSSKMSPEISQLLEPQTFTGEFQPIQRNERASRSPVPGNSQRRLIWYKVAGESFAEMDETMPAGNFFNFKGSEVDELKVKLAKETGLDDDEFIICSRNPFSGKLYPLKLDLPPHHYPMTLFVVPSSSEVAKEIASWESPLTMSPKMR